MAHPTMSEICVALDLDEVLADFLSAWVAWLQREEKEYQQLSVADFNTYSFSKVMKCTEEQVQTYMNRFADEYLALKPIEGAVSSLSRLSAMGAFRFVIVTARSHVFANKTKEWVSKHYPGVFKETDIHLTNGHAIQGPRTSKLEICKTVGAHIFIDDSLIHIIDCHRHVPHVLLMDLHARYTIGIICPPLVTDPGSINCRIMCCVYTIGPKLKPFCFIVSLKKLRSIRPVQFVKRDNERGSH